MWNRLDDFCNSTFWDANLTWYTESPRVTPCFQKTVLVWISSLFLWTFSSVDIYFSLASKRKNIPWNWRNVSKLVVIVLLIVICFFEFFYNWFNRENIALVDITTPLIKIISLILCACLTYSHKKCGRQSSGVIFLFWFFVVLFGTVQFLSELEARSMGITDAMQISYMILYTLSVLSLILNFFSDLPPSYSEYPRSDNPNPEDGASFPSKLTFSWFDKISFLGYKRPLTQTDLWPMKYTDRASQIYPVFNKHWTATVRKNSKKVYRGKSAEFRKGTNSVDISGSEKAKVKPSSILPAICKAFGPTFLFGASLKLVQDLLSFINPQLLQCLGSEEMASVQKRWRRFRWFQKASIRLLIGFVEGDEPQWRGFFYAGALLVVASVQTLLLSQHMLYVQLAGLRIKTALTTAIYRKALRLSNSARKASTQGEIVNLMAVDAQRFGDLTVNLTLILSGPLQIVLALYFLWQTLGPSVLAGLGVMILMIPLNGFIASRLKILQIKQMKRKDERVKMMNEILSGIKVLKLYAWEPCFEEQVMNIRNKETSVLRQAAYFNASTSFIWTSIPFLVSLVTFATYLLIDSENVLDAMKAFVALSLFNILRAPLTMLPMTLSNLVQAGVSVKRINKFMNSDEIDPDSISHATIEEDPLVMEKGTFSWGIDEEPTLHDISLRVKAGSLVAIVGTVGSGKTSLISAFLGEMDKKNGRVNIQGTVAYVPQLAWIQNATLQDNILFGKTFNSKSYYKVVEACALKQDLEMLPGGDQTEIGEKGINLSGGQKQRVSLARAVYNDSDIYFLDDPLSAVDSHVGKHIFENVISSTGILRKKTRIFVTHSVSFLPEVDQIVVLKDGTVSETGTFRELLEKKGAFSEFLTTYLQEVDSESLDDLDNSLKEQILTNPEIQRQLSRQKSVSSETGSLNSLTKRRQSKTSVHSKDKEEPPMQKGDKLIEDEKAEIGGVKLAVYKQYLRSIGVGLPVATVIFNTIYIGFTVGSNLWLSEWSSDPRTAPVNGTHDTGLRDMYLTVYGLLGLGQTVSTVFANLCWYLGCVVGSITIHKVMLQRIIRAPMSFFDTTKLGRLLNRFASEINVIDNVIPVLMKQLLSFSIQVLATFFVLCYSTPIFGTVIIPTGILYYFLQRFYVATSRQLKRLESVSRSPIYSHFGETVSGCSCIRAYNVQNRFIIESEQKVDNNQACFYPGVIANRWLAVRLEMVSNMIIFFSALFSVLGRGTLSPGMVGLSVSYALQLTQILNWLVRMTADLETNIVAVERIKEYIETPQEAAWEKSPSLVDKEWPHEGRVEFLNYKVRYREGLELVLKGITFSIKGGEKIGIVGRTGAGKSSLTLSLFRLIEAAEGKILIDGIDISKLGLHSLRSRLTIIPQDPVLFSGSLRMNLDPFERHSDEQIWRALELAHLKAFVKGLPAGLHHEVTEGGENFSVGQRQLICLARALLRKTKILVLDEATAAVDLETDDLIQKTIRSEFKECTILTIAHRLNTIVDSDRVLVLDKGTVAELEPPSVLLKNRSSIFYGMARDAGLV